MSQQPAALAIFDLEDPDWVDGISKEGLESIPTHLDEAGLDPTDREAAITYISSIYANKPCT